MFKKFMFICAAFLISAIVASAQEITLNPDQIKNLTAEWKGERFADGRPKVSDELLARVKNISIEEAWGYLRNKGYHNQYEGDWMIMHPDSVMSGRVVTAQYTPLRPDLEKVVKEKGKAEGREQSGGTNSWPIDILQEGDVYVADGYGKIVDGTLIGDNLGNAIYSKSKRGVIFNGSVRDVEGLSEIEGFNFWIKGQDPSYIQQMMLSNINTPIRIGRATVLPGDVVLAKKAGTIFIPAHLLADLVINSEFVGLRDEFGHQMLREGKYTPGQIDSQWSEAIKNDFIKWTKAKNDLPMSRRELEEFMENRTW